MSMLVMLLSQDMVRREILRVRDGADTKAVPLLEKLLEYGEADDKAAAWGNFTTGKGQRKGGEHHAVQI